MQASKTKRADIMSALFAKEEKKRKLRTHQDTSCAVCPNVQSLYHRQGVDTGRFPYVFPT